jgi:hypothetical protein
MSQPYFGQVWGWNSHSQSWGLGVLWDSQKLRAWLQGSKHLALGCFWYHWKVSKFRCPKWPCMSHLDIYSPSYGQKKGRESNWQFDSQPLKVGNRPDPDVRWGSTTWSWKALKERLVQNSSRSEVGVRSYDGPKSRESKPGQFRDSTLGVLGQITTWAWAQWSNRKNIIWGKVVASPESRPWWVKWVQGRLWLVPTPKGCRMSFNQLVVSFGCRTV